MKTAMLKINPKKPEDAKIRKAAAIISRGNLVAFPTETVYGLGANALEAKAVAKIFRAKKRPFDDPLIVHICDEWQLYALAKNVNMNAKLLADKFWPGPLTLVLPKAQIVPHITTGGLDSVAVRMPKNKIALALIRESCCPIAAPSANLFGKPSPTSAGHVKDDLNGKIDCIIDGGKTRIGVESTVLDLTGKIPVLLRPGAVTLEELRKTIGKVNVHPLVKSMARKTHGKKLARAPGMKYRHYAPRAQVIIVEGKDFEKRMKKLLGKYKKKKIGVIASKQVHVGAGVVVKRIGTNSKQAAARLFRIFREFDDEGVQIVIAHGISEEALGMAVMNRMRKAASKIVK